MKFLRKDQLKKLMNDPGHSIETNSVLAPSGVIEVEDIYVSLRDTILSAAEQRLVARYEGRARMPRSVQARADLPTSSCASPDLAGPS